MPAYEYEVVDGESGEVLRTFTLGRPVDGRDAVMLRRRQVPSGVCIAGSVPDPTAPAAQTLGAYKRLEQRHGNTTEFRRRIGHTPEQVKQAWGNG